MTQNQPIKPEKYSSGKLSAFSVIVVFVLLAIIGASLLPNLNVQLNPSSALPQTTVSFYWSDVSAKVIEQEVTSKLEGGLNRIRNVKSISSESRKGSGQVTLEFKKGVDLDAIRFEMAMIIRQLYSGFPAGVSYPSISMRQTDQNDKGPLMVYRLNASASPLFIQKYAEDHIAPQLSLLKGINKVSVYGGNPFEWEICFDSKKLETLGLVPDQLSSAINSYFRSDILGSGNLDFTEDGMANPVRVQLASDVPENPNWNEIPIAKVGGRMVLLGDVAKVQFVETKPQNYYRINGLNTVNLVVYPERGVNNLKLANQVKETMAALEYQLPPGYDILLSNDSTVYIKKELNKIAYRTLVSLVILLLFVLAVSRKGRYLVLILISIMANLIIACVFYYFLKIEIHLYSLAGMTVSFGMIIDNSIIMIDHLRYRGNRKVFLAIFAATLTTIGALSVIFFLKEEQRVNLVDFSLVVIINLSVSMVVALFFIPAVFEKLPLTKSVGSKTIRRKKRLVRFNSFYSRMLLFGKRFAWIWILLFVLGFGLPVQWLPEKIEKETKRAEWYNKTLGSSFFKDKLKKPLELALGGSLRLFSKNVFEKNFYSEPTQTRLYVNGSMPEGCTVQQLNEAVVKMENYLSRFDEVDQFQTSIYSPQSASIVITFKGDAEQSGFPYQLKEQLIMKANSLGAIDWGVYGVGQGFSNALYTGYKNSTILLEGYNYEQLYRIAEAIGDTLRQNPRVNGLEISGSAEWNERTLHEYYLGFDQQRFALNDVTLAQFYSEVRNKLYSTSLAPVFLNGEKQAVTLVASDVADFTVWDLNNKPLWVNNRMVKLSDLGQIEKRKTGNNIYKRNQQYQLAVQYDFIGPDQLSRMVRTKVVDRFNEVIPMGYRVYERSWGWNRNDKKQYGLILLVIVIIYFICSILLESFRQPLAIISLIPFSFIGVFLTFYLFEFNFDQGGFASFILLCGITVNAGLYIVNDYNQLKRSGRRGNLLKLYVNAFNHKIIPIILTIFSTVLGLVPFVMGGQNEVFWFSFAVGAMGGLIFSLVGLVFYLPLFLKFGVKKIRTNES